MKPALVTLLVVNSLILAVFILTIVVFFTRPELSNGFGVIIIITALSLIFLAYILQLAKALRGNYQVYWSAFAGGLLIVVVFGLLAMLVSGINIISLFLTLVMLANMYMTFKIWRKSKEPPKSEVSVFD